MERGGGGNVFLEVCIFFVLKVFTAQIISAGGNETTRCISSSTRGTEASSQSSSRRQISESANSPLHPGTTSLTYGHNGAGESEDKIKAPYVSCLNGKSDHTFTARSWEAERENCDGRVWAWHLHFHINIWFSSITDLADRKEQEWRGQCHFKRRSSYRAFGFLLCLVDFLYSENGPSEQRKVSAVVKRPHSIEGLIART